MQYLKAITAAIVTGLGTLATAYQDNHVSNQEWVYVAIATLTALAAVWAVPNTPTVAPKPPAPPVA